MAVYLIAALDAIGRLIKLSNHVELLKPLPPSEKMKTKNPEKYEKEKEKYDRQNEFWEAAMVE